MRTMQRCAVYKQLWKNIEYEILNILQVSEQYQEQDVLELQNKMEDEFTSNSKTPIELPRKLIKETAKVTTTEETNKRLIPISIDTSPMKKLKLTNEDDTPIPLLTSIKGECRAQKSNIPKICFINGKEHQIQAIIVNPINEPDQTIICQASQSRDSQGREILKGGRNVGIHITSDNSSDNSDN